MTKLQSAVKNALLIELAALLVWGVVWVCWP